MKKITAGGYVFGPYETVETLADRYRVNGGAEIPFNAIGGAGTVSDWGDYVPPVPPATPEELAAARAEKNAQINAKRLDLNFSTFEHAGKLFACDQLSRSDIDGTNGFVSLFGVLPPAPGWPGGWKAVDNSYLPITTVAAWKEFYGSLFAAGGANFARAQELKALLAQAETLADIAAVIW